MKTLKTLYLPLLILALLSMVSTLTFANNLDVAETSDDGSQGTVMVTFYKNEGTLLFNYFPPGSMYSRPTGIPYFFITGEYSEDNLPEWSQYAGIQKAVINPSMADYRPKSTAYWFYNLKELQSIEGLENLNTSEVTDMQQMFRGCRSIEELDLSGWDTRNVENMYGVFWGCTALTDLNISDFNTSSVRKSIQVMRLVCPNFGK